MADVIVVREDMLGRPRSVDRYGEGDPLPEYIRQRVPRETQVKDPREEVKHTGGPWYLLPSGEKVRGKDAVRDAGFEVP